MACPADRLQVGVCVRTALALRNDMVNLRRHRHLTIAQAWLTETSVTIKYSFSISVPLGPIPALVPASAPRISKSADLTVCLMYLAVA